MKREAVVTGGITKVTTIIILEVMGLLLLTVALALKKRKSILRSFTGHLLLNSIRM